MSKQRRRRLSKKSNQRTSWDPLAAWYDGWVGEKGSKHHQALAIPAILNLLNLTPNMAVLDIGAGQGVLAPHVAKAKAKYTGVEISSRLLNYAKQHHGAKGTFLQGDARKLPQHPQLNAASFDAAVFMLSIQDMDALDMVLQSVAWVLKEQGIVAMLLVHPCFRIPRQSGWGWDEARKLQYRRIDRYLTPLDVPLRAYPGQQGGASLSFHRPLSDYINGLTRRGLLIDRMDEIPTYKKFPAGTPNAKAKNASNDEIPLFLALRARKIATK